MKNLLISLLLTMAVNASAEGMFITGLGYIAPAEYRVDNEINPLPLGISLIPMIAYRGERLSVMGPNISYALMKGITSLSLNIGVTGDRYKARDLKQRDSAINGGVSLRILFLTIKHGIDISNVYHGNTTKASIGWRFKVTDSLFFSPSFSKEFLNKSYVNYYYGVSPSQAGYFSLYQVESAVNNIYGGSLSYSIDERNSIAINYAQKHFDDVIYESPTINKSSFGTFSTFWNYKF